MKTVLILSAVLCAALTIRAASVVQPKVKQGNTTTDSDSVVASGRAAAVRQARFSFCLDGWASFRGKCYLLVNNFDTWRQAQSYCQGYDANLASVHNIWELNFLQRLVKTGGHPLAWIGGYFFEGEWRWEDGSAFNYHKWDTEASTDAYQCLQLDSQESKGWSNHGCNMHFPFVCQVTPSC